MKLHVKVTQDDIDQGVAYDSESCPIARAIKRDYEDCAVQVGPAYATIYSGPLRGAYELTDAAAAFVYDFDYICGGDPEEGWQPEPYRIFAPFEFDAESVPYPDLLLAHGPAE